MMEKLVQPFNKRDDHILCIERTKEKQLILLICTHNLIYLLYPFPFSATYKATKVFINLLYLHPSSVIQKF